MADIVHGAGEGLDAVDVLEYLPEAVPRLLNVVDRPLKPGNLLWSGPDHRVVVRGLANVVDRPDEVVQVAGVGYDLVKVAPVLGVVDGARQLLQAGDVRVDLQGSNSIEKSHGSSFGLKNHSSFGSRYPTKRKCSKNGYCI